MPRSHLPTLAATTVPVVLVVGATTRFVEVCSEASAMAAAASVKECDARAAATMAAKWRPLVILATEAVIEADPGELEALARDVQARLVRVADESVSSEELQARLLHAVAEAERLRAEA